jgi:hypothetical protein
MILVFWWVGAGACAGQRGQLLHGAGQVVQRYSGNRRHSRLATRGKGFKASGSEGEGKKKEGGGNLW